jgi:hypothetical protein
VSRARAAARALAHGPAIALSLLTLVLVGQPLYANDTWIHLALGEAFLTAGPYLSEDPALFAAPGPPSPNAWLGAASLAAALNGLGFTGLRLLHVLLVSGMGLLVWRLARRETRSRGGASLVLVGFILLSTWRLVQLRPDLYSMAATLGLWPLLFEPREGPGPKRILMAGALGALWANLHAAFLLGPLLVLGVALSLLALAALPFTRSEAPLDRRRGLRLLLAGGVMAAATLLNPLGPSAHWAYFGAGEGTLALGAVTDEWAPTHLFLPPPPNRPPSGAAWLLSWASLLAVAAGGLRVFRETRGGASSGADRLDPALFALSVAGLAAALLANRFLWMEIFALVVGVRMSGELLEAAANRRGVPLLARAAALGLVGAAAVGLHLRQGDWPLVSRSLIANATTYEAPYYGGRFNEFAVAFLAETGVSGRIYNPYPIGGFMSFWLAPRLEMSSSGTMNVEAEAMQDFLAIAERAPRRSGESYSALLDRHGLDLFLGTGLPIELIPGRRGPSQVPHLEAEPDWMLVYRSLRSAVYLRRGERNRGNLDRVALYYERAGVPFDRAARGLDLDRVLTQRPDWAIEQGLIPTDFEALVASARPRASGEAWIAEAHRLAMIYVTLGLYERALEVDGPLHAEGRPGRVAAMRRSLLCLLHLERDVEAQALANELDAVAARASGRSAGWAKLVRDLTATSADQRAERLAQMPFFRSELVDRVLWDLVPPMPRDPQARADRR